MLHALYLAAAGLIALAALPGILEIGLVTTGVLRRKRTLSALPKRSCHLAIVVPAHNEEVFIGRCVASLQQSCAASELAAGRVETVVVADNCTDQTAAHATAAGARVLVRTHDEHKGKGYALRMAFETLEAEGFDAFLVIDADSIVSANLVPAVVQRLNAGSAAIQCRYRVANHSASVRARLMDLAFLAFNVLRPKGRAGWGLSAGILGNGFALHSDTLAQVPYHATSIVEDLEYHLRMAGAGLKVDFIDEATVYGEIPTGGEAARVQRSRWEGGRLRMLREWAPRLANSVGRGQWRLAEPLAELLAFPLAYQVLLTGLLLAFAEPFRAFAAFGIGLVVVHVAVAAVLGGDFGRAAVALAAAPFYILWKVTTLEAVFSASRKDAAWVRTGREETANLRGVPKPQVLSE